MIKIVYEYKRLDTRRDEFLGSIHELNAMGINGWFVVDVYRILNGTGTIFTFCRAKPKIAKRAKRK